MHPSNADAGRIKSASIGGVVDLRSAIEAATDGNDYFRDKGAEILQLNVGADVRA